MQLKIYSSGRMILLGLILLWSLHSFGQSKTITGKVTAQEDGTALPGVNVLVKGSASGTITDANGAYSISVSEAAPTLVFSYIGYTTQEVAVGSRTTVDVQLAADVKTLQEVVVTGYGSQSKRDITGAVATIDTKDLLAVPAANVAQQLQGRAAGVTVGNDNSPGGGVMVRIRGFGTINDNSPLYVIDGVPTKGNLNTINQNDIESIQILKDASAASIYGSRAGNGVVIITTKKGKAGKPKFTYDAYYGTQQPIKFLDLLNTREYADLLWESRINAGVVDKNTGYPSHAQFGKGESPSIPDYIFPSGAMEGDPLVNPANYSNNIDDPEFRKTKFLITRAAKEGTNWMDEVFDPAPIQNHQLGVSGGSETGTYAVSLNYFNQQGIMKYTGYKRYSVRSNTEFKISPRFRFGENFTAAYGERVGQVNGNNSESNPISFAYRMQPIIPVYDIMGNFAGTKGGDLDNARNPVAQLYRNRDNINKEVRLFGNAYAEVDILKSLTARTSFGVDYNLFNLRNYNIRDIESSESAQANSLSTNNSFEWNWVWYNTLTYNTSIGELHKINVIAGTEAIKNFFESFNAGRSGFVVDDLENRYLNAGNPVTQSNSGFASAWRLASEFAKVNYGLADKYLLDLTVRRDRSSRFAEAYRSAIFPAVSVGWRVSGENFMKGLTFIDDFKLRAGWGQTGNQEIGNYNRFTTFGSDPTTSNYSMTGSNSSAVVGYELTQFGNPNARWETTTSTNIGLDAAFFNNRVNASVDWYNRRTSDMLFPVELQLTQGVATNPFQNIGEMTNKGVDLALNYNGEALANQLTYSVGLNFSTYRNNVVKTDGNPATQYFGFGTRLPAMSVTQADYPISSFFGYVIDGIFQTDDEAKAHPAFGTYNRAGSFKFRDVNEDGVINAKDRTIIGNPHPDFSYGVNVSVGYKNFTLTLFGQGVQGNDIFNYVRYWTDFPTFAGNRSKRMLYDSWRPGKTDAKLPQLRSNDAQSSVPSTYYIEDGSYLRLKNVQLAYQLPQSLVSRLGSSQIQVYFQIQNLATITKYTGLDPEINLRNSGGSGQDRHIGIDEGAYPASRSFIGGLNFSF